jgi:hypothetical protein
MASVQVAGVMIESDGKGSRVAERSLGTRGQKSRHEGRCRSGHWTPIEKVKECDKLLSDLLHGIPI